MSQNITLSPTDLRDISKIKGLILQHKNQTEMAVTLGKSRETINRKISRWMQTEDFNQWANTLWLEQYGEISLEDKKEAFRQLTKIICSKQTRKTHVTEEITKQVNVKITSINEALKKYEFVFNRAAEINLSAHNP